MVQAPEPGGGGTGNVTATQAAAATYGGSQIAQDALKYVGHCYSYGGAPGTNGQGCWDCSSFCNWVIGHDLSLPIPGYAPGAYNGSVHGPPTGSWIVWTGCSTVGDSASDADVGDLLVWETHMGIATGGGNMVSALNANLGTLQTTIADGAPTGEILVVRRMNGVSPGAAGGASGSSGSSWNPLTTLMNALGITDLADWAERIGLIFLGGFLLIVGLWKLTGSSIERTGGKVAEVTGATMGNPEIAAAGEKVSQRGKQEEAQKAAVAQVKSQRRIVNRETPLPTSESGQGTLADSSGTSPEFRQAYLDEGAG
jgi:NlpC/P60 family